MNGCKVNNCDQHRRPQSVKGILIAVTRGRGILRFHPKNRQNSVQFNYKQGILRGGGGGIQTRKKNPKQKA